MSRRADTPVRSHAHATPAADGSRPSTDRIAISVAVTGVVFAIAGVPAAWLWDKLADIPRYTVVDGGAVLGEEQSALQFEVDLTYAWLGAAFAFGIGFVLGWLFWRLGWIQVVATAAAAAFAGYVAWKVGMQLGPDAPEDALASAAIDDTIPDTLHLHWEWIVTVWPVAGLAGLIPAVWIRAPKSPALPQRHSEDQPEESR